ncbi:MAG: response regulator transcription factor [Lachnospiraceae bacterium]|nr:response regulator transcription factor [Lachnospiraceae bacterium]
MNGYLPRIIIADKSNLFREGLKSLIETKKMGEVVDMASDYEVLTDIIRNGCFFEIVIIDTALPGGSGIELHEFLTKNKKNAAILFVSDNDDFEAVMKYRKIDVKGYLSKNGYVEQLSDAILQLSQGHDYYQPQLVPKLNSVLLKSKQDNKLLLELTRRELEVLKSVASGMMNREIAMQLKISERTVKNHIASIFKKIKVSDRTQAAIFAIRNNLIQIH